MKKYFPKMSNTPLLSTLRHSCAHILASAVKELFPEVELGIGPDIEDGFYYDFLREKSFTPDDLTRIEKRMHEIIHQDLPFVRSQVSKEQARELFEHERFKLELLGELPGEEVFLYAHGGFTDLCKGPHVDRASQIKAFRLLSISGAYWRGNEKNPMLQRIYGTAFQTQEELDAYIQRIEEAKERDHRKLGPQLEIFDMYQEQAGAGLVFYLSKGAILRRLIEDWEIQEHIKRGYVIVNTPHILDAKLWQQSGHLDFYRENMYMVPTEEGDFCLKPMNCPGHILIYKSKLHSYRDLPVKIFELGTVYRHEKSGVLHGLLRVRGFTQDDAHIFCAPEHLEREIKEVLAFVREAMRIFGFTQFEAELSTRPEKYIGDPAFWDKAESILEQTLHGEKMPFTVNRGDGAFYGPKIDIKLQDALGRRWQCATVQLDFSLPERFKLGYIDADGVKKSPVMIHRVILGSLERFVATLIEHYKGRFPVWLNPLQVKVIPITKENVSYAQLVREKLVQSGIRCEVYDGEDTLGKKIRNSELEKPSYILVVGKKEESEQTVNVRITGKNTLGVMRIEDFIGRLQQEVSRKGALELVTENQ